MRFRGHAISAPGAALAIVCFFLPWVSQSCGNEPPRVRSGWELAADGDRLVLLVPLTALAALVLALLAWRRGYATGRDGVASTGLGALALLFLFWKFGGEPPEGVVRDVLYGLWATAAASIAIVIGGVMDLVAPPARSTRPDPVGAATDTPAAAPVSGRELSGR
jgi:hypothetical protein